MAPIFGWAELADTSERGRPLGRSRGGAPTSAMAHAFDALDDASATIGSWSSPARCTRPRRADAVAGSYSAGTDPIDDGRAGPAHGRARPHPRRAPGAARRTPAVLGPRRAPRRAHQQRRRADGPLLPGRARLPADDDVREPRPRRAPPTSSSTSAPATPSPSSTSPASTPATYAEVLGGLHHLAISIEVEHWKAAKPASTPPACRTTTSTRRRLYFRGPDGERLELIADPFRWMYGERVD